MESIEKHELNTDSLPHEWHDACMPKFRKESFDKVASLEDWTRFTSCKAILANTGKGGSCYKKFTPFNVDDVQKQIGVYLLNEVSPSPRVEYKMQPQSKDPVNENDIAAKSLGLLQEFLITFHSYS